MKREGRARKGTNSTMGEAGRRKKNGQQGRRRGAKTPGNVLYLLCMYVCVCVFFFKRSFLHRPTVTNK